MSNAKPGGPSLTNQTFEKTMPESETTRYSRSLAAFPLTNKKPFYIFQAVVSLNIMHNLRFATALNLASFQAA
jgi:hypothetical protein